jgi:hypothetical protein
MKTGIELLESNDKIIAVMDKDVLESHMVQAMHVGAVDKVVNFFTNNSYSKGWEIENTIRSEIVKRATDKFLQENYQAIFDKINLDTVANMAAVNIARGVSK